jgi:D-sedoheptulose 7-phosphate isomerase
LIFMSRSAVHAVGLEPGIPQIGTDRHKAAYDFSDWNPDVAAFQPIGDVIVGRKEDRVTSACDEAFSRRVHPATAVAQDSALIARACQQMALRFRAGGKLIAFGDGAGAADAAHLAVEFVHPAVVGKRALPAISLANDGATLTGVAQTCGYDETFAAQIRLLGQPGDIAVGIGLGPLSRNVRAGLAVAGDLGLLTIALTTTGERAVGGVDHRLAARTDNPRIAKEIHVTIYHILWELAHVFLDQPVPGDRNGRTARPVTP